MLSLFSVLLKINKVSVIPNYNLLKNVLCNLFLKNSRCNSLIFLFDDATYKNKHKFLISFLVSLLLFSNNISNYQEILTEIIKNNICEENSKCDVCEFFILNILKKIIIKYNPSPKEKVDDTRNQKSNTFYSINYNNKSSYLTYLSHINSKRQKLESKSKETCTNNNNSNNSHSSLAFLSTEKSLNKKLGSGSKHRKCSLVKRCSFNSLSKTKDTKIIPSRNSYNISLRKKTTSSKSQVYPSNLSHYNNISSSILQLDSFISQFKTETEMIKNQINYS